jgi:hypothetical protein
MFVAASILEPVLVNMIPGDRLGADTIEASLVPAGGRAQRATESVMTHLALVACSPATAAGSQQAG